MTHDTIHTQLLARNKPHFVLLCALVVAWCVLIGARGTSTAVAAPSNATVAAASQPGAGAGDGAGKGAGGVTISVNGGGGAEASTAIQILVLMTVLTLAPSVLIMMTGFTRILIVMGFIRNALGTPTMPPNQILIGLSLFFYR